MMTIQYALHKNPLTNGADNYRAMVKFAGTVDLEGVIEQMIARGSTVTKADALAVLQDYHATIAALVLQGFKVVTPDPAIWSHCKTKKPVSLPAMLRGDWGKVWCEFFYIWRTVYFLRGVFWLISQIYRQDNGW